MPNDNDLNNNAQTDQVDNIEYGIRRARRDTTHHYRDSSSLSPAQILERETLYYNAEIFLDQAMYVMHMIFMLVDINLWLESFIVAGAGLVTAQIDRARNIMRVMKKQIEHLFFLCTWILSHGECELAFLYAEDLSIFIRRRNRFYPPRYRTLADISRSDCYSWFGMSPHNLRTMYRHWRVPNRFRSASRHTFSGEECFIITLYYMIKGIPFTSMARNTFGGDPRRFSDMFGLMIDHLYITFYHKISGDSMRQWMPRYLDRCRALIHNALSDGVLWEAQYLDGEIINEEWILHHFDYDSFRVFGFMDDMAIETARPGDSRSRDMDFVHDIQRSFYSGYLRAHGLKAQVVYLHIGIIGSVFITELRQYDNGVQNMSGLNDYLISLFNGILIDGLLPTLYVDGIFRVLECILPRFRNPTPELHLLNVRLASLRICIEHVFADHDVRFKIFQVPRELQLTDDGVKVRRMCLMSFFILNCYYCIHGHRCRFFGHVPPSLEKYIPLEEDLPPPPAVQLGEVWDYGVNHPN